MDMNSVYKMKVYNNNSIDIYKITILILCRIIFCTLEKLSSQYECRCECRCERQRGCRLKNCFTDGLFSRGLVAVVLIRFMIFAIDWFS